MFRNKLFKNILTLCVMLAIAYTLAVFVILLKNDNEKNNALYSDRSRQIAETAKVAIDDKITLAASIVGQLAEDKEIVNFLRGGIDDAYNILMARNRLSSTISNFSNSGCTIDLYRPDDMGGIVITGNKSINLTDYIQEIGADLSLFQNVVYDISKSNKKRLLEFYPDRLHDEQNQKMMLIFKFRINADDNFYFITLLNKRYLFSDYIVNYPGEEMLLMYDRKPLISIVGGGNISSHSAAKNIINTVNSEVINNLSLYFSIPKYNFWENKVAFIFYGGFITLLSLILCSIIIYWQAKRIYRPIGLLVDEFGGQVRQTYDEVEMIRDKFTEINTNNEELMRRLTRDEIYIREKLLKDLLYGVSAGNDFDLAIRHYGLDYLDKDISVTVVEYVDTKELKDFSIKQNPALIKRDIERYFSENIRFKNGFELFEITGTQFVIITAGHALEEIKNTLREVSGLIEVCYNVKLLSAIGNFCQDLKKLQEPFYDALNILGYQNLFAASNVVTMQNWSSIKTYYYPMELEKNLIMYVQYGEKEKAYDLLYNIMNKNKAIELGIDGITELKFVMLATGKRVIQLLGRKLDDYPGNEQLEAYQRFEAQTLDELEQNLKGYFGILADEAGKLSSNIYNTTLRNILEYIEKNYSRDISLTDVASFLDISPGYVGRLFRQNSQTSFKEYLNKCRVDKAKMLLVDTPKMKISSIAESVGFTNTVSFNRVFKQYALVSPSDYRKINNKNEQ